MWGCFVSIPYALASRLGPLCCLFLRCLLLAASWYCYFLDLHPPYGSPPRLKSATFGGGGGGAKRLRALFHATSCASKNNEFVRDILQKWPLALPGNPFAWNNALPSVPHLSLARHRSVSCSLSPPSPPPFPPSPSPLPLLFLPFPCPSSRSKDG